MLEPIQESAFTSATNGTSTAEMSLFIASTIIMLFFIWAAWCLWGQGKSWMAQRIDLHQLMWSVMRIALVAIVVAYWVRPS